VTIKPIWLSEPEGAEFDGTESWLIMHPSVPFTPIAIVRRRRGGDVTVGLLSSAHHRTPVIAKVIAEALLAASEYATSLISASLPIGRARKGDGDEAKSAAGELSLSTPSPSGEQLIEGKSEIQQASPVCTSLLFRLIDRARERAQDVRFRVGCYDKPTDIQFVAQNGLDDVIGILGGKAGWGSSVARRRPCHRGVAMKAAELQIPERAFEEASRVLLVKAYERLGAFIRLGNGKMIAEELALMSRRCAGAYGPDVYESVGRQVIQRDRASLGFCVTCEGSPRFVGDRTPHPMCPECLASIGAVEEEEF